MIEREQKLLLDQLKHYMEHNRQSFEEIEKSPEFENIKTSKYEEAQQRVLTSLVLGAIIKSENISVEIEELEHHLADFIQRHGLPPDKAYSNENVRRQAFEELLTAKVLEFLLQNAKISYTTISSADQQTEKESKAEKGASKKH